MSSFQRVFSFLETDLILLLSFLLAFRFLRTLNFRFWPKACFERVYYTGFNEVGRRYVGIGPVFFFFFFFFSIKVNFFLCIVLLS